MPLKENIARAARPLFARGGRPTVAQIAAAAGISRATFHRVYGSRDELIRELEVLPDPGSRERILAAAIEMVGRTGLDRLSMDELAAAAGVSRASVYRLFPGKAALFAALVRAYSPMETVAATMERLARRPPPGGMPAPAASAWPRTSWQWPSRRWKSMPEARLLWTQRVRFSPSTRRCGSPN